MENPPARPKRLVVGTVKTDFSFRGGRYRVSLNGPPTPKRAEKVAAAVSAFAQKQAEKKQRFVYFLQCGERIKVGIAKDPMRRLRALQTGNATEFKLLAAVAGDESLERAIHVKFESAHVVGEWFVRRPDLEEFMERAKRCDSISFNPRENEIQMSIHVRRPISGLMSGTPGRRAEFGSKE